MITGFYNVSIATKDTERLVKFYRDILGIPVQFDGFFDTYDGAMLGFDHAGPMLCIWNVGRWGEMSQQLAMVLKVDDLNKTYQELTRKGLDIDPPQEAKWGGLLMKFHDPEGNIIVLLDQKTAWHYRGEEGSKTLFGQ